MKFFVLENYLKPEKFLLDVKIEVEDELFVAFTIFR